MENNMIPTSSDLNPKPLNQLIQRGDTSDMQLKAFICNNLGYSTLLAKMPMYDFYRMSDVANERSENGEPVTQRKLDLKHATELARYILKGLISTAIYEYTIKGKDPSEAHTRLQKMIGKQPYAALQPIVTNLRTAGINGKNLRAQQIETSEREGVGIRLWLGQRDILWVVDGQHRRKAMQIVIDFLEEIRVEQKYPAKKNTLFPHNRDDRNVPTDELTVWSECYEITRAVCSVSVEIHLGLEVLEERQLFHDLNNLAKKVETSLALEFDSSNPVNAFIKEELIEKNLIRISPGDITDWHKDDGGITRKHIVSVNAHLLLNKSNINGATPGIVQERLVIAKRFWEAVLQIPGFGEESAKAKTVAAQPVVLKALAKLTYDFAFGRFSNEQLLNKLLDRITDLDFSHDNPMWRYYQLTPEEIDLHGLNGLDIYLPDNSTGNRDPGLYEETTGWMRFGNRHNDIFPILADMIRWKINLPNRHKERETEELNNQISQQTV
ncbi:DNA sulfur modification protein DndB [Priestia aryabhattai]|uniref:DNA sulfur modification protein DndB n=1 Tax=Priestia aryabhattai TaxID=412384 RepID=UPI001C3F39CA|nr:DNA sulfur modification protein DndB [Priestia aryabhattai]